MSTSTNQPSNAAMAEADALVETGCRVMPTCSQCFTEVEAELGPLTSNIPDSVAAERYRLTQAAHLLHRFRDAHAGHNAQTIGELSDWVEAGGQS